MLKISEEALIINERFFKALEVLKRERRISGISSFTKKYGIALSNLYTIKNEKWGAVKAEYLTYLVRDYGFSADWLLTGEGDMFRQTPAKT